MSILTRLALDILQSSSSPPGLKAVACSTLLAAMDQPTEVPGGCHMAVWTYLLGKEAAMATMHRHQLFHQDVARDAMRVLRDPDAGDDAQDLALSVLRGPNLAEVGEQDLSTLADHMLNEGNARRVSWLVEQVHEQRGLEPAFIVALRDRLTGSVDAAARVGGVAIGGLLPRLDEVFAGRMFLDPSPSVRTAVADALDSVCPPDREKALVLIRDQLGRESHRSVLSALYFSLGNLVRGNRRIRQWEPPDDAH